MPSTRNDRPSPSPPGQHQLRYRVSTQSRSSPRTARTTSSRPKRIGVAYQITNLRNPGHWIADAG